MAETKPGGDLRRVALVSDVPAGTMLPVTIDGRPIVVANVGDEVVAFQNSCLHARVRLSEGALDGDVVTCRWHQWQYCTRTGEVLTDESPYATFVTFPVHVVGDEIFVEPIARTKITARPEEAGTE